ncbi:hypothetical protein C0J45_17362 [Silurus meridionalis]|nr:hypothetical protein C0J45_17362 [Silurus meridionalis]
MACSAQIKDIIACGKLGDLIEFSYPIGFSHWGVYVGTGRVVHFAVADENELQRRFRVHILEKVFPSCGSILLGRTKIHREHLTHVPVPKGAQIKISNGCHHYPASSITDMRWRLNALLGEVLDYNLLSQNCEHFATFVRYGVAVCNQKDFDELSTHSSE